MEMRYMGFEQAANTRSYRFARIEKGGASIPFVVTADLTLFFKHRVAIQEGPTLCAEKLAADLTNSGCEEHQLTSDDIVAYASNRAANDARKAELRRSSSRRQFQARVPGQ
jgi:hypothetical protein